MEPDLLPSDFAVLRLSLLAGRGPGPASALRPSGCADDDHALRDYLAAIVADPVAREAIAVSSLPLDETLDKVARGIAVKRKHLRGGTMSAARYLIRMRSRATPFGLMAGVTSVRFGDQAEVRTGTAHRKYVRPDQGWLKEVVRGLQREPAVLRRLRVVTNDLCVMRNGRLVLPAELNEDGAGRRESQEGNYPLSAVASDAVAWARRPVLYAELAARLSAVHPDQPGCAEMTLAQLVDAEFLLTELLPPATCGDPLGHVLDRLSQPGEHPLYVALRDVQSALEQYAAAPIGRGYRQLRAATSAMRSIHATDRPVHVDLAMDAEVVLPRAVPEELAQAASAAWQLARPQPFPLDAYLGEFIQRYGLSNLVPVNELLDPHAGLGAPASSARPPGQREPALPGDQGSARDTMLCGIAQRAAAQRDLEVVLDDELIRRLAGPGQADRPPTYIEVCARLLADSVEQLQAGDFRLVLGPPNYTRPGAMFGRFLDVLPELREPFAAWLGELADGWSPASLVQLAGPSTHPSAANVSQVPRLADSLLAVGAFADGPEPHVLRLGDVAIGARPDRLYAISLRTGEEIVPLVFHANEVRTSAPNPIRFLFQIGAYRTPRWPLWDWGGAAAHLPFLPRIRFGRTVLAPARWLPDLELCDQGLSWARWRAAVDNWRAAWDIPDRIEAGVGDWLLPLDLDTPADLEILRDEFRKRGTRLLCREEPAASGYGTGWAEGRTAEVAIALRPVRQPACSAPKYSLPLTTAADRAITRTAFLPGGEWLSVRLDAATVVHDEIIAQHLPALLNRAAPLADRWFFVRYHDPAPHLRIRFHGAPRALSAELLPQACEWASGLGRAGLLGDLAITTYRPEIARYGGPLAMEPAERAFCADSRAVVDLLTLRRHERLRLPLALLGAASCLDLAARMHGPGWQDWLLATYPRNERHQAFTRYRREALSLLDGIADRDALAGVPGSEFMAGIWDRRGPDVSRYGQIVHGLANEGLVTAITGPFRSIMHLHLNRLAGMKPLVEEDSYAIARGAVQARAHQFATPTTEATG